MDIFVNLLIWVHIVAFVAGGASGVVGPIIAGRMGIATPEVRLNYFGVMNTMSKVGRASMVGLLISGPLVIWLKYGGAAGLNIWFAVKMAMVLVMLIGIIVADINAKKEQAGDAAAARVADIAHKTTGLAFLVLVFAAVFAFN